MKLATPGDGPPWLPGFAASILAAFKSIMRAPFRLWDAASADLPPAANWKQGLVYDRTEDAIFYSDGASWTRLPSLGFADLRYVQSGGSTMTGRLVVSMPILGLPGIEIVDTAALGAGSGGILKLRVSSKPNAADLRIGLVHFGAADSGGAVQNSAAIIAWSGADWGSLASEETYLGFEVTPSGGFARIEAARLTGGGLSAAGWLRPGSFTVAGAPGASAAGAGAMIFVSNESGGAVPAFSDGTNWRRVTDRAVIS